ncbi:hypothetical protein [Methylomonas koyamae]|uniref:hypothetical protein n=1 Tax=Methylomonas koyamae TaxID=702114 RepID=UPI002873B79D|nr:hypothetical protein [Methylomonas koyamae]WNB75611.1 hypothetical protein RI210_20385 [Methylomonas koyamae]
MTPSELLNLMESSIIKTGFLRNTSVYGRAELVALSPDQQFKGVNDKGAAVPVYNLKQTSNAMAGFKSYICDYTPDKVHYQILDQEADYCFTVTMNGCTFGIGSQADDGTVMVTHGNMNSSGLGEEYGEAVDSLMGSGTLYITPHMYARKSADETRKNLTTFGIRINGTWNFFYQKYEILGPGQIKHLGLFPFKTTMLTG